MVAGESLSGLVDLLLPRRERGVGPVRVVGLLLIVGQLPVEDPLQYDEREDGLEKCSVNHLPGQ